MIRFMASLKTLFLLTFFFLVPAFFLEAAPQAQPDPAAIKTQANSEVQAAAQLMKQAQTYLQGRISKDKMQVAVDLYIKAGQMAEHAAKLYQALGSNIDFQNSQDMVKQCLYAIQQIKGKAGQNKKP